MAIAAELGEEETSRLLAAAPRAYHAAARDLLVAAFLLAWHRLTGKRDLLLHLEGHGREDIDEYIDVTRTTGWFTSLYPVLLKTPSARAHQGDDCLFSRRSSRRSRRPCARSPTGGSATGSSST